MDSEVAPTPSSPAEHKPSLFNYTDGDPTDASTPPLAIELKPVTYKEVVHNQPQEQQYSTIGPSNPVMNNVQVDGEEYSKLNHDVHAKSIQSLDSKSYERLQHPHTDFTTPQRQSTEGKSPETSEDNCYCHFITSYNYLSYR